MPASSRRTFRYETKAPARTVRSRDRNAVALDTQATFVLVHLLASRRRLLTGGGQALFSATAVALLAGSAAKADSGTQTADQMKSDMTP